MQTIYALHAATVVNGLSDSDRQALQRVIDRGLRDVFPAAALTVLRDGEVLFNDAWGWIDPETRALPVAADTLFDLASVTKLFTATAFLAQVSAGKVRLSDPLGRVVPEFVASGPRPVDGGQDPHSKAMLPTPPGASGQRVDPRRVTFWHLLTHTSGLAPWRDVYRQVGPPPAPPDAQEPVPRDVRWRAGLKALCRYPFVGEADAVVRYSDLGLMLLAEAAARLDGAPGEIDRVIAARVAGPLELSSLTFNPVRNGIARECIVPTENDPIWRERRVWGEVHDENACGVGGVSGHAGLFANARDVAAFGQAWLDRDVRLGLDAALMNDAVREHAETDGARRGLGWMLKTHQGAWTGDLLAASSYGHTGFTGTSLIIDPTRRLVVACLTNRVYAGREYDGIYDFRRALHTAIAQAVDGRKPHPPAPSPNPENRI